MKCTQQPSATAEGRNATTPIPEDESLRSALGIHGRASSRFYALNFSKNVDGYYVPVYRRLATGVLFIGSHTRLSEENA